MSHRVKLWPRWRPLFSPRALLISYAFLLLLLIGHKPLWLDELWQLFGTRNVTFEEMLRYARAGAGGALFPHFLQWLVLKLGFNRVLARIPAFAFGIATCVCFWFLARRLNVREAMRSAIVFALLPIQVRYTLEARPYSQALFFSCWATLLLLQIKAAPSARKSVLLMAAVAGGLYSQPFMLFEITTLAVALATIGRISWRGSAALLAPVAVAVVLYIPWYLSASRDWGNGVALGQNAVFDAKLPLRVLREYTGGGYLVGLSLLALVVLTCVLARDLQLRWVLLAAFLGGLFLPLLAEQRLHYFYAARHLIFALPPGVLLTGSVLGLSGPTSKLWPNFLSAACVAACIAAVIWQFSRPAEDWDLAAKALRGLTDAGRCIASAGTSDMAYYEFFEPSLRDSQCRAQETRPLVMAIDPYSSNEIIDADTARIIGMGYRRRNSSQPVSRFRFVEFSR